MSSTAQQQLHTTARALRDAYTAALRHRRLRRGDPPEDRSQGGKALTLQRRRGRETGPARRTNALADLLNPVGGRGPVTLDSGIWTSLAAHVLAHGLDAARCIRDAFALVGDGDREPRPNELMGLMTSPRFQRAGDILHERCAIQLRSQIHIGRVAVRQAMALGDRTPMQAWAEVLNSPQWPLSPLFRFCVAVRIHDDTLGDTARRWRSAARRQYAIDQELYDSTWALLEPGTTPSGAAVTHHKIARLDDMTLTNRADGMLADALGGSLAFPSLPGDVAGSHSTGIPFLDALLGGGQAPGSVYGLMGPYGSCKTTVAVMLAVEAARALRMQHEDAGHGAGSGSAFFVSYEARNMEAHQVLRGPSRSCSL